MPAHRSPAGRRLGVHFARVASFTAAVTAFTTIVVADVVAAEPEEAIAALVDWGEDDDTIELAARDDVGAATLSAAGVKLPEAAVVVAELFDPFAEAVEPPAPKKKKRKSKLKFGRFEGY
ncbi:MAG: hypothetical protein R3B09_01910 [Nannocystaceae bacterium]